MFTYEPKRSELTDPILFLKNQILFSIINNSTVAEVQTSEGEEATRQFYVDVRFFKQTETSLRSFWKFAKCLTAVIDKQLGFHFLHYLSFFLYSFLRSFLPSFLRALSHLLNKQAGTNRQSADSYSGDGRFDHRP